eukprot:CAMPEP_0113424206 /NCGR_PEP_ID=MMETSP0013_2-20120614/29460_1 /TAXON_ID=2843 ORGANISM="Skeletonema costatum, Strain 1716" /NCGR_SAMPLE_ID=MMETSP0013_2 /ASSEMBLY_ACC=CAM_ASM_000158 /LENGTH=35 /DNA_ID=CAMNT_0000312181 /DNA_START=60 /DNA_END=164 /DNA_ORIENTATION=- /assembly_acc=CAM_ASM_000158
MNEGAAHRQANLFPVHHRAHMSMAVHFLPMEAAVV